MACKSLNISYACQDLFIEVKGMGAIFFKRNVEKGLFENLGKNVQNVKIF